MNIETPFQLTDAIVAGGRQQPFFFAGPCVIESDDHARKIAEFLAELAGRRRLNLVFKASFDKANRSSVSSFRGPGMDEGLKTLARIRSETGLPVITDVHTPEQAAVVAEVVDVLQIPAFLCRQTDLLVACGRTGLPVNVKKGQFLAPEDMLNVVEKVASTGNRKILLTERGSTFGYHNLVVDMRGLPVMRRMAPVVFDATHSLQLPGGLGSSTGGAKEFFPYLARAAAGAGVDGFFFEVHTDPENALSDATTQLSFEEFDSFVPQLEAVWRAAQDDEAT